MSKIIPFGKLIRDKRKFLRKTQSEVADLTAGTDGACTSTYISYIERRNAVPELAKVDRLAEALGIPRRIARESAGYADGDYAETAEGSLVREFAFFLDSYNRLDATYKDLAKPLVSGLLDGLYEAQLRTTGQSAVAETANKTTAVETPSTAAVRPRKIPVYTPARHFETDEELIGKE